MKNFSKTSLLVLATSLFVSFQSVYAGSFDGLDGKDKNLLLNNKTVVKTENVAGSDWPKILVYRIVKATPEECAALFHDFNFHSQFMGSKKMTKSRVEGYDENDSDDVKVTKLTANPIQVEYQVKDSISWLPIPPIVENYTVRDTLTEDKAQGSYKVTWTQVKADTNKSTDGYAQFEPVSQGSPDTLIVYKSFTVPNRSGASLGPVKNRVIDSVKSAVEEIAKQVGVELGEADQKLLSKQKDLLHRALDNLK